MIELAVNLDAERLEVAQVQYYGWALKNQTAFLPTREQLDNAGAVYSKIEEDVRKEVVDVCSNFPIYKHLG